MWMSADVQGTKCVEKLPKISSAWVGCTSVTDRDDRQTNRQTDRQTNDRRTGDSK